MRCEACFARPLLVWHERVRALFPFLPAALCTTNALAPADGPHTLTRVQYGAISYVVRSGYVVIDHEGPHEAGHALDGYLRWMLRRQNDPEGFLYERYWAWRFAGTAYVDQWPNVRHDTTLSWAFLPGESWAEAFAWAMKGPYVLPERDKSFDYGKPLPSPALTLAFFVGLAAEVAAL